MATNLNVVAGNNALAVMVPTNAALGVSFARFRLSTAGNHAVTGAAADGEVEDYRVSIVAQSTAAELAWFRGTVVGGEVWLRWQTLSEDGVMGYVIRRTGGTGSAVQVTAEPVWAEGRWIGAQYEVKDATGVGAGTWSYVLVALNDDGTETRLRTVRVTVAGDEPEDVTTGERARILGMERVAGGLRIRWAGGQSPYVLERSAALGVGAEWSPCEMADPTVTEAVVPMQGTSGFFRVRSTEQ